MIMFLVNISYNCSFFSAYLQNPCLFGIYFYTIFILSKSFFLRLPDFSPSSPGRLQILEPPTFPLIHVLQRFSNKFFYVIVNSGDESGRPCLTFKPTIPILHTFLLFLFWSWVPCTHFYEPYPSSQFPIVWVNASVFPVYSIKCLLIIHKTHISVLVMRETSLCQHP